MKNPIQIFSNFILPLVLVSVSIFIGMSRQTEATSGACSSHGGVDCAMGRQANGMVYCNDGWPDSMVQYDYTVMCQSDRSIGDPYAREWRNGPPGYQCKYSASLSNFTNAREIASSNVRIKIDSLVSSGDNSKPNRDSLNYLYVISGAINQRYIDYMTFFPKGSGCAYIDSLFEQYKTPTGKCSTGFVSGDGGGCITSTQWCQTTYGDKSTASSNPTKKCACVSGYTWNDGWNERFVNPKWLNAHTFACVPSSQVQQTASPMPITPIKTNDQKCQDKFGLNSNWYGTKDVNGWLNCGCNKGFRMNSDSTACIAEAPKRIPTPIPSNTSTPKPSIKITPTPKATQNQKPIITNEPIASVPVTNVDNNKPTERASEHKGVVSRMWSWFTGLLGH